MSSTTGRPRRSTALAVTLGVWGVALLLGVAAAASPLGLVAALTLCVGVVSWGWAGMLALPTPRGTVGVVLLGGLALVLAVAVQEDRPWLLWVPVALSAAMIAAFVHQVFRKDGRPRVVESVSSVVLAVGLLTCGVLLVPASRSVEGLALVLTALAAAVASAGTDLLAAVPRLRPWLTPLAMASGGVAALLLAVVMDAPPATWLLLGVASGGLSHALRAVLGPLPTLAHPRPRLVTAVVSVLVVGVVPYLVALAFLPEALGA
ncbi:hypothetical protein [Ornithinimicrobium flavum]|uniref:hypothetical protein n=1 Tax=Ornithinimicrobium flavum TaxID=1288636 RepID=UPI00106FFDD3|nr:hypothetical protein [Ornithinimicrobium flavum]